MIWRADWPGLTESWDSASGPQLKHMKQRLVQWERWRLRPDSSLFAGDRPDPATMAASATKDRLIVYLRGA